MICLYNLYGSNSLPINRVADDKHPAWVNLELQVAVLQQLFQLFITTLHSRKGRCFILLICIFVIVCGCSYEPGQPGEPGWNVSRKCFLITMKDRLQAWHLCCYCEIKLSSFNFEISFWMFIKAAKKRSFIKRMIPVKRAPYKSMELLSVIFWTVIL
jgi:hypothetical protein